MQGQEKALERQVERKNRLVKGGKIKWQQKKVRIHVLEEENEKI